MKNNGLKSISLLMPADLLDKLKEDAASDSESTLSSVIRQRLRSFYFPLQSKPPGCRKEE